MDWLTETKYWPARRVCGEWEDWLINLHVVSENTTALCYFMFPFLTAAIYKLYKKDVQSVPRLKAGIICLCTFVATCGVTHLTGAMMFNHPAYRLDGFARAACALSSVLSTVWAMNAVSVGLVNYATRSDHNDSE